MEGLSLIALLANHVRAAYRAWWILDLGRYDTAAPRVLKVCLAGQRFASQQPERGRMTVTTRVGDWQRFRDSACVP